MTIKELIEKLEKESDKRAKESGDFNGTYAILESWYDELKINKRFSYDFNRYYDCINGLIRGLRASFFITKEECEQLIEDLQSFLSSEVTA